MRHYFTGFTGFTLLLVQWHEGSFFYRLFAARWITYLGAISYEWYLVHMPFLTYGKHLSVGLRPEATFFIAAIGPVVVSLLFAMAMHHWFYIPISQHLRARLLPVKK